MKTHIVITGGGFAGLALAKNLCNACFDVTLIDKNNYHQFPPLFYQVATAGLEPSAISFPFRKEFRHRKNFRFVMAEVKEIVPAEKKIHTSTGPIEYDIAIVCTGTKTNYFGLANLEKNAFPMKSVDEALRLRNHILQCFEKATRCTDSNQKKRLLNFVVVGAGPTGIELAGALSEMRKFTVAHEYPELADTPMRIVIVESSGKVLGAMSHKASKTTRYYLEALGVELLIGKSVTDYDGSTVKLSDGSSIETNTALWASGVSATTLPGIPTELLGKGQRIKVDEYNRVAGSDSLFAIGDVCLQPEEQYPNGHPQLAQVAIQQAEHLAKNLRNKCTGKPLQPFHYHDKGSMATIGRHRAVADLPLLFLRGWTAWVVWLVIHLFSIMGVKNRFAVLWDWMWQYFKYDTSLHLIIRPEEKK